MVTKFYFFSTSRINFIFILENFGKIPDGFVATRILLRCKESKFTENYLSIIYKL